MKQRDELNILKKRNKEKCCDLKSAYAPKHEVILYGHKGRSLFRI